MPKKKPESGCNRGWICAAHPDKPWPHEGCGATHERCSDPNCDRDHDAFFANVHCFNAGDQDSEAESQESGVMPKPIIFCPNCGVTLMKILGAAGYWVCENKHLWLASISDEGIMLSERPIDRILDFAT